MPKWLPNKFLNMAILQATEHWGPHREGRR